MNNGHIFNSKLFSRLPGRVTIINHWYPIWIAKQKSMDNRMNDEIMVNHTIFDIPSGKLT